MGYIITLDSRAADQNQSIALTILITKIQAWFGENLRATTLWFFRADFAAQKARYPHDELFLSCIEKKINYEGFKVLLRKRCYTTPQW